MGITPGSNGTTPMVQAKGRPMVPRLRLDPPPGQRGAADGRDPRAVLARSGGEQVVASARKDYHCVLTLCDISFRLMFFVCADMPVTGFAHRASR